MAISVHTPSITVHPTDTEEELELIHESEESRESDDRTDPVTDGKNSPDLARSRDDSAAEAAHAETIRTHCACRRLLVQIPGLMEPEQWDGRGSVCPRG